MKEPTHYRCSRCGETFEIPEAVIERWQDSSEHFGQVAFETKEIPHCPFCDGDDLQDVGEAEEKDEPEPAEPNELSAVIVDIARAGAGSVL